MWFASDEEEERLAHALLASLLLHVLILGYAKGVVAPRPAGTMGVLSVSFRGPQGVVAEPVDLLQVPARTQAMAKTQPVAPAAIATTLPKTASAVSARKSVRPPDAPGSGTEGLARTVAQRGYGVVDVVMLIGSDGHPQTLIWDSLPALTQAQFEQLERMVRRQVYPSTTGARLTQEVDVFSLLGLGRHAATGTAAVEGAPPSQ